ncbi:hypothetical protein ZIOFF_048371 [Zingiber officinale]|uniref:Uncharacterized protein n=1 Tax=Zingiber officinale TaxID=94328 RepID=A0A8J5FR39_ZINOF|nr:hypothetical protein ZIOFF_048371 [Zingiber officinale]
MDSSQQQQRHHQQGWVAAAAPKAATVSHGYHQPTTLEEVRSLWIGDLQYWVDENYLDSCFSHTREPHISPLPWHRLHGTTAAAGLASAPFSPPQMQYQAVPAPLPAQALAPQLASADETRTLGISDLQHCMDESYIYGCLVQTGKVISVKLICNRHNWEV